ncbi:hypothetical protein BJ742DRAFT_807479 [Cladochytrium replicatum]|nr:hypothetical protein BJ742DRAFT_807479 [Cladochytrium replicatum]
MRHSALTSQLLEVSAGRIELRSTDTEGRFCVAATDIPEGSLILNALPYGIIVNAASKREACAACFRFVSPNTRRLALSCSACSSSVYFCSSQCAGIRTRYHDIYECAMLAQIALIPRHWVRLHAETSKRLNFLALYVDAESASDERSSESFLDGSLNEISPMWKDQLRGAVLGKPSAVQSELFNTLTRYNGSDLVDLARWIAALLARLHLERDLDAGKIWSTTHDREAIWDDFVSSFSNQFIFHPLITNQNHTPPTPTIPRFSDVLNLASNHLSLPINDIIRVRFLYNALSHLPSLSATFSNGTPFSSAFTSQFLDPLAFANMLQIRTCNGFGLFDGSDAHMGQALYPFHSYFNHACVPNLARHTGLYSLDSETSPALQSVPLTIDITDDSKWTVEELAAVLAREPVVSFYSIHPIAKGTQLNHCYVDVNKRDREERRGDLHENYDFLCNCARCRTDIGTIQDSLQQRSAKSNESIQRDSPKVPITHYTTAFVEVESSWLDAYACPCGVARIPNVACLRCGL